MMNPICFCTLEEATVVDMYCGDKKVRNVKSASGETVHGIPKCCPQVRQRGHRHDHVSERMNPIPPCCRETHCEYQIEKTQKKNRIEHTHYFSSILVVEIHRQRGTYADERCDSEHTFL